MTKNIKRHAESKNEVKPKRRTQLLKKFENKKIEWFKEVRNLTVE
jgi:hypothetical protein